jgi:hypothetical protein
MQERALARTRRPDDRDELTTREAQVDFVECAHRLAANPVLAHHIAEFDGQHRGPPHSRSDGAKVCCRVSAAYYRGAPSGGPLEPMMGIERVTGAVTSAITRVSRAALFTLRK